MTANILIDWLQVTYPSDAKQILIDHPLFKSKHECNPLRGYKKAEILECGATVHWNPDRPEMGIHVQMTGKVLQTIRPEITDQQLLFKIIPYVKKVSRLDFAIDTEWQTDFNDLERHAEIDNVAKTRLGYYARITSPTGNTMYWGSPKSDKRVRIYDKRGEMGIDGPPMTRLELQLRNDKAMTMAKNIVNNGLEKGGLAYLRDTFDCFYNPLTHQWGDFTIGELIKYEDKQDNWESWILGSVAGSLFKRHHRKSNEEAIEAFFRLMKAYDILESYTLKA